MNFKVNLAMRNFLCTRVLVRNSHKKQIKCTEVAFHVINILSASIFFHYPFKDFKYNTSAHTIK